MHAPTTATASGRGVGGGPLTCPDRHITPGHSVDPTSGTHRHQGRSRELLASGLRQVDPGGYRCPPGGAGPPGRTAVCVASVHDTSTETTPSLLPLRRPGRVDPVPGHHVVAEQRPAASNRHRGALPRPGLPADPDALAALHPSHLVGHGPGDLALAISGTMHSVGGAAGRRGAWVA